MRELSARFWQTAKVLTFASGRVDVDSDEQLEDFSYHYFLRESDVRLWPITGGASAPTDHPNLDTGVTGTSTWIAGEAHRLKVAGKIREGMRITDLARLLEKRMSDAADTDKSLRKVGWRHIKNNLPAWGLWPISLIN